MEHYRFCASVFNTRDWAEFQMAQHVDRKLRATAHLLGVVTRKDLAAAFQRVNSATPFHVERAHKWVQGRAQPREAQLYRDWAMVLELDRSGEWMANCDFAEFVEAVAAHHSTDRDALWNSGIDSGGPLPRKIDTYGLSGTYVCYSYAWSPYFRGQIIRGTLTITSGKASSELHVTYTEALPTGHLSLNGTLVASRRALSFVLQETNGGTQLMFCLFPPTLPVSLLGGLMCGSTVLGPDPGPTCARIVMVRLPSETVDPLDKSSPYLPSGASLAADLESLGVSVSEPRVTDGYLATFIGASGPGSINQPSPVDFRSLAEHFAREWVTNLDRSAPPSVKSLP